MDNYLKFATFNYPETVPVGVSFFHLTWKRHGKDLDDLVLSHPNIFPNHVKGGYEKDVTYTGLYEKGKHTDHWGCLWDNIVEGHDSICVRGSLPDLSLVDELPDPVSDVGLEHGWMFLRLTYIRGYENAMVDFYEERPEFYRLIEKVVAYNLRQVNIRLDRMGEGERVITYADDMGMQNCLPVGATRWRKILKPCYARLCKPSKDRGKLIYLHSDGCIYEVIPDLRECGIDIINPQIRANGLANLVCAARGEGFNKIAVSLDLDRQLFPLATPSEIEDHIMECVEALYLPEGGLALSAEIAEDVPIENIEAILNGLEKARVYK